jgi:hypothetical protein
MVEQSLAKDQPAGGETALAGWPKSRGANGNASTASEVSGPAATAEAALNP